MQLLTKALVVLVYVGPPIWLLFLGGSVARRVIQSDYVSLAWLNPFTISGKYAADELAGKTRVPDAIYQDGMIVGRLRDGEPQLSVDGTTLTFPTLIRTDNLEPSRPFIFRTWNLKLVNPPPQMAASAVRGMIIIGGGPDDDVSLIEAPSRVLQQVTARILGQAL